MQRYRTLDTLDTKLIKLLWILIRALCLCIASTRVVAHPERRLASRQTRKWQTSVQQAPPRVSCGDSYAKENEFEYRMVLLDSKFFHRPYSVILLIYSHYGAILTVPTRDYSWMRHEIELVLAHKHKLNHTLMVVGWGGAVAAWNPSLIMNDR